jgi:hypothetical protein
MSKKKVIAVVITTFALTVGSIGVAGAASKGSHRAGVEVSSIIGLDTATIKARIKAGESLAQIAGDKKDALIAALVADHTKRIDAAVTAGMLTAAQAVTMKSKVVEHVTAKVNAVGGKYGFGKGRHGHKGGAKAPTLPTPAPSTGA